MKEDRILFLEKQLESLKVLNLCDDLNNATDLWKDAMETSIYIEDGVEKIPDSMYMEVLTFCRWELFKLKQMIQRVTENRV